MTQLIKAENNEITKQMDYIASKEDIDPNVLREHITRGWVVIPANKEHQNLNPIGIGKDLRIKVNANIGTSPDRLKPETELEKLDAKSTGMEEVISIVETNNCFSNGVQMVTGCSFGNNALIYRDIGKTAVTVAKRDGSAIRIVLKSDFEDSREEEYPEAYKL